MTTRVGVISDTHGLLRPAAAAALAGCELILHAGDIGRPEVIDELETLAPVLAVRGNIDSGAWAQSLPYTRVVAAANVRLYLIHDAHHLRENPVQEGWSAVISGHSHRPSLQERGGVIYLNPGAAGPRRFTLPVSVAVIDIVSGVLRPSLLTLDV